MAGTGAWKGCKIDLIRKRRHLVAVKWGNMRSLVSGMINLFMTGLNNAREPLGGLFSVGVCYLNFELM